MADSVVMTLDAPLQSWGGPAVGTEQRPTDSVPSLSGVCGLIANALGRGRGDSIDDLASAEMHIRVDRSGVRIRDWQTVGTGTDGRHGDGAPKAASLDAGNRAKGKVVYAKSPITGHRWYLSDAAFTILWTPSADGIASVDVADALRRPERPLYLGRRSCPPAAPVLVGVTTHPAAVVFRELPLLRHRPPADARPRDDYFADVAAANGDESPVVMVEVVHDADGPDTGGSGRFDVPTTFDPALRWHGYHYRWTTSQQLEIGADKCAGRSRAAHKQRRDALSWINESPVQR